MLEKNVYILDSATIHENINSLTRLAEKHVPIWKPLRDVVKKPDLADIDAALPNATINVNAILSDLNTTLCRTKIDCQNATVLYNFLSSKRAAKVFRYDPKASKYPSVSDISDRLARSLDVDLISRQMSFWRTEASWNLSWLKEILIHLSVILGEGGNLLDVASAIDFEDVTNILGVPDLADGIVNILKDKTVDKLFDGYIFRLSILYMCQTMLCMSKKSYSSKICEIFLFKSWIQNYRHNLKKYITILTMFVTFVLKICLFL